MVVALSLGSQGSLVWRQASAGTLIAEDCKNPSPLNELEIRTSDLVGRQKRDHLFEAGKEAHSSAVFKLSVHLGVRITPSSFS